MSAEFAFVPDWPDLPAHIGVLSTMRMGGVSQPPYDDSHGKGGFNLAAHVGDCPEDVARNRILLDQHLPAPPQWLSQIHGIEVLNFNQTHLNPIADACFATLPGVVCAVQTADCLPVLFCDGKTNVVAAAHAGWRGLVGGVLENTLKQMLNAGAKLNNISVWLGPAIGAHAFEVGPEVREQFAETDLCALAAFKASEKVSDKFYADIYELARLRLRRAGVEMINGGDFCTVRQKENFYSYRRDGITGRMASMIWIKH